MVLREDNYQRRLNPGKLPYIIFIRLHENLQTEVSGYNGRHVANRCLHRIAIIHCCWYNTAAKESRKAISGLYNRIYIIPWRFLLLHYLYQNLNGQRNVYKQNIIWSSHGYNHSYAAADVIWIADFHSKVNSVNRTSIFQYFRGSYYIDDGLAS